MKKEKKKKNHVPLRLNILFLIVFVLFSGLVVQLANVQILRNEDFKTEVLRQDNSTISTNVPRGKIYDRTGKVIVDNEQQRAITYTRYKNVGNKEMIETAKTLATYIEVDTTKVKERDKQDYWIITNEEAAGKLISAEELKKLKEEEKKEADIYKLRTERIPKEQLQALESKLEEIALFTKMRSGYKMTPQIIKREELTEQEFAVVSESLERLPGVDVESDWTRSYPLDHTLRSVLGNVTDEEEGLPGENIEYYLVRDYNRNDRVGVSYIEQQYEDILHGKKGKIKTELNKEGTRVIDTKVIHQGKPGYDLNLAFDVELQRAIEEIIIDEMNNYKGKSGYDLMDRAFVVMMDPFTGEVLSMAGKQMKKKEDGSKEIEDHALGAMSSAYEMGSVVKGATILAGLQSEAISTHQMFQDEKMYLKSTPKPKNSWKDGIGTINAEQALAVSSNIYMFKTALAMEGLTYTNGMSLGFDKEKAIDRLRYYYNQFGLGVPTGIDLPNESLGFKGKAEHPGLLLDFSIGQFDTYTTLQLAQYISTIANGGYRMKPQIVKSITETKRGVEDGSQRIVESMDPVVLNRVDMPPQYIQKVQRGFEMVVTDQTGTANKKFGDYDPNLRPALKTGTAQAFVNGVETYNYTLVGYAPATKPEIAFSVVVPSVRQTNHASGMSLDIGRRILDKYFELQSKREMSS